MKLIETRTQMIRYQYVLDFECWQPNWATCY